MPVLRESSLILVAVASTAGTAAAGSATAGGYLAEYYPGDLGQAIVAVVAFGILLLILRKWGWRPVIAQLRRREEDIAGALTRAQQREREATELVNHYKARLARAEQEAEQLVAESRKQVAELHDEALRAAQDKAKQAAQRAREQLERAKEQALQDLRTATAEMASDIAEKVIRKELSPDDQQRLLDRSLEEITRQVDQE